MSAWQLRDDYAERVTGSVDVLKKQGFGASVGVVLGSGLGNFVDQLQVDRAINFGDIPGFFAPTVQAHKGRLVQGRPDSVGAGDDGEGVLVLQGRLHAYEGHAMEDVVFPVATLLGLGVSTLVLTNAAGGLDVDAVAGDLVALTGLVDFHWTDSLRGLVSPPPGDDGEAALRAGTHLGPFDRQLAERIVVLGAEAGIPVSTGAYVSLWGPSYETPAEIGFLRRIGGTAVGMSTGPEAALAHALGARIAGISCITNVAREHGVAVVTHEEVIEVGAARRLDLARLLMALVRELLDQGSV